MTEVVKGDEDGLVASMAAPSPDAHVALPPVISGIKRARSDSIGDSTNASQQLMAKSVADWLVDKTMRAACCLTVDEDETTVFERTVQADDECTCTTTLALMHKLPKLFGERDESFEELAQERHVVVDLSYQSAMWQRIENMLRNVALLKASYYRAGEHYDKHAGVCHGEEAIRAFEVGVNECQVAHLRRVTRKLAAEVAKHLASVSKTETMSEQEEEEDDDESEEEEDDEEEEHVDDSESSAEDEVSDDDDDDHDDDQIKPLASTPVLPGLSRVGVGTVQPFGSV